MCCLMNNHEHSWTIYVTVYCVLRYCAPFWEKQFLVTWCKCHIKTRLKRHNASVFLRTFCCSQSLRYATWATAKEIHWVHWFFWFFLFHPFHTLVNLSCEKLSCTEQKDLSLSTVPTMLGAEWAFPCKIAIYCDINIPNLFTRILNPAHYSL